MLLSGSGLMKIKYATFDEMNPKLGEKYGKYRPYKLYDILILLLIFYPEYQLVSWFKKVETSPVTKCIVNIFARLAH